MASDEDDRPDIKKKRRAREDPLQPAKDSVRVGMDLLGGLIKSTAEGVREATDELDSQRILSTDSPASLLDTAYQAYSAFFRKLATSAQETADYQRSKTGQLCAKRPTVVNELWKAAHWLPECDPPAMLRVGRDPDMAADDPSQQSTVLLEWNGWHSVHFAAWTETPGSPPDTPTPPDWPDDVLIPSTKTRVHHASLWHPGDWAIRDSLNAGTRRHLRFEQAELGTHAEGNVWLSRFIVVTGKPWVGPRQTFGRLPDICGITYAINGLTHQMANRLLWPAQSEGFRGPVAWPAGCRRGVDLSVWLYGRLGSDWPVWHPRYENWMRWFDGSTREDPEFDVQQLVQDLEEHDVNWRLHRRRHVSMLLANHLPADVIESKLEDIVAADAQGQSQKRILDAKLLSGSKDNHQYQLEFDQILDDLRDEIRTVLNDLEYESLFGLPPEQPLRIILDPLMMPGRPPERRSSPGR